MNQRGQATSAAKAPIKDQEEVKLAVVDNVKEEADWPRLLVWKHLKDIDYQDVEDMRVKIDLMKQWHADLDQTEFQLGPKTVKGGLAVLYQLVQQCPLIHGDQQLGKRANGVETYIKEGRLLHYLRNPYYATFYMNSYLNKWLMRNSQFVPQNGACRGTFRYTGVASLLGISYEHAMREGMEVDKQGKLPIKTKQGVEWVTLIDVPEKYKPGFHHFFGNTFHYIQKWIDHNQHKLWLLNWSQDKKMGGSNELLWTTSKLIVGAKDKTVDSEYLYSIFWQKFTPYITVTEVPDEELIKEIEEILREDEE